MTERFVIVGAGLAGASAAAQLREDGFDGDIVVIGQERHLPYYRPALSKDFLKDPAAEPPGIFEHPADWYAEQRVELMTGSLADSLDLETRYVGVSGLQPLQYDALLLATGSRPRRLGLPGEGAAGIHYLRTIEDSEGLRAALAEGGRRVAIVGTGWIGMEVAAAAREYGNDVTVIGRGEIPLASAIGPDLGRFYADVHTQHGVQQLTGRSVRGFAVADGRVTGVETDAGTVAADVVLIGAGAVPDTGLAETAGLPVDNGVLVDAGLLAAPGVFAAGDVANPVHPQLGARLRVEHWANAIDGGKTAAKAMLGETVAFDRVPYFFSDQYDVGMEFAGFPPLVASVAPVYRGDPSSGEFIAFWVKDGRLVGGMNVNVWDVNETIQRIIASGAPVDPAELADPSVDLATLVSTPPVE